MAMCSKSPDSGYSSDETFDGEGGQGHEVLQDFRLVRRCHALALDSFGAGAVKASTRTTGTVIFDWDDTLFPTWYVCNVVLGSEDDLCSDQPLPSDSPFLPHLAQHAELVERVLRTAAAHAQVGIVTLGEKGWVNKSTKRFLPNLNIEELLSELNIPIVYARECLTTKHACADQCEGVNLYTVAKTIAMRKVVKKHRRKGSSFGGNVISIGDSKVERDAVKDLLWGFAEDLDDVTPLCKTVKLVCEPSLDQLGAELVLVSDWLEVMLAKADDFDLCMDEQVESTLEMLKTIVL